jgi:hypothetical protein
MPTLLKVRYYAGADILVKAVEAIRHRVCLILSC